MNFSVKTDGGTLPVQVTFKPIQSIRLKVFPSGEIRISVPENTPETFISDLLVKKRSWIEKRLELFHQTSPIEKEDTIRSGTATRILGRQLFIKVLAAPRKRVVHEDRFLLIYTPTPENQSEVDRQFQNWWQKNSKLYFQETLDRFYPIVGKHGVEPPTLTVRKMQTLWGSCTRSKGALTLNYYLYKAPVRCIEYVILHELLHFLYPRHDRNFYGLLTVHMPDWQERKRLLDFEIVRGT